MRGVYGVFVKDFMAVRIRKDEKIIVCAAKSELRDGDVYLDDNIHYELGVNLLVLSVCGLDENGAHLWEFHEPLRNIGEKIEKEEKCILMSEN